MKTQIQTPVDPQNPPAVHEWTGPTGHKFRDVRSAAGNYYHDTTPPQVIAALDGAQATGARVRLWYGDSETGLSWLEEYGVRGTVGRSTGWKKTALLINNKRSTGGPAILAACIVRLIVDGREAYRHPKFSQAPLAVSTCPEHLTPGLAAAVLANGEVHARFKTENQAAKWVDFMTGPRSL